MFYHLCSFRKLFRLFSQNVPDYYAALAAKMNLTDKTAVLFKVNFISKVIHHADRYTTTFANQSPAVPWR